MPTVPITIGAWMPDRISTAPDSLRNIANLIPRQDGWSSLRQLKSVGRGSLDAKCSGAYSARTQDGTNFVVAGTDQKLFLATTGNLTDESGTTYTTGTEGRWEFELYGDFVIATNLSDAPQVFEVGVSATFANLDAAAPFARHVGVIGEFVMFGNIAERGSQGYGTLEGGVHWSGIGNHASWELQGTNPAIALQSDYQSFPDDGGEVTGIVSGSEWGLILREREVLRAEYVGGDTFFAFEKIDSARGCIVPGGAISVGRITYFPSQEGFLACDGTSTVPIGHEVLDRYWRNLVDLTQRFRVSTAHSSELRSVFWHFPDPGAIFGYNYELGRWTQIDVSVDWLLSVLPLDSGMDDAPFATADMDDNTGANLGDVNLDDLGRASVAEFGAIDSSQTLVTFSADTFYTGFIETGDISAGARSMTRYLRPVFNGAGTVVGQVASKLRANDSDGTYTALGFLNSSGTIPVRSGGRYHKARLATVGEIQGFAGLEAEFSEIGRR